MAVLSIKPMKLPSTPWVEGYVLDYHTVSSTPTGDPYYRFDTKRTDLGERLFQLKYRQGGKEILEDIVDTLERFLAAWKPPVDCIVPAVPSVTRATQPIVALTRALGQRLKLPICENAVAKVSPTPQMKNVDDWTERQRLLAQAVQRGEGDVTGKTILLLDDLIESGSTLRRVAEVLLRDGGAKSLYALVLTRTK